jgi:hypothetical protein
MSITDIPTDFGEASFMRVLLPGFLFTIILSYTFFPLLPAISGIFFAMDIANKLLFWIISGYVLGMLISSKDFLIYKILNGYKCIHPVIAEFLNNKEIDSYNKDKQLLDSLNEEKKRPDSNDKYELAYIDYEILRLSSKLRNYPFNKNIDPKFFYPITWTTLGNIIAEYETYPEICYGMVFDVFWYRLWHILSKDEQEDISQRGAKADFLSYMSFLFLLYSLIAGFGIYPQVKDYLFSRIDSNTFQAFFAVWLGSFVIFYIIHRFFYDASIDAHEIYGGHIKALFDLHHNDLLEKLKSPTLSEITKCEEYSENFEDYSQFRD